MKQSQTKIDLGISPLDELFMDEKTRTENKLPKIYDIPLSEIDPFPDHPFQIRMDEDMEQLVESVKERGIITPVILRPKEDGRYEIVSGHRRTKACELAGIPTVRAEIRDLTRDEAIILMVESNLQRSVILPSEKAFSYKMRLDAMKRQGMRTDLTCRPVGEKFDNRRAGEIMGEAVGESERQIQRYIRLTNLIPELLKLVDEGQIALRPAVELSYLKPEEQFDLSLAISACVATPSHAQAIRMRSFSEQGRLTTDVIDAIMDEEKPNQKEKVHMLYNEVRRYIPDSVPYEKTSEYIMKALQFYKQHQEQDRGDAR